MEVVTVGKKHFAERRTYGMRSERHRDPITQKDLARMAGVSTATVSKVLSDSPSGIEISEQTKDKIRQIAREMGYTPNASARALRRRSYETVGLYFPRSYGPWVSSVYSELTRHLSYELEKAGQGLLIMMAPPVETEGKVILPRFLEQREVDGVLLAHHVSEDLLSVLASLRIPYVMLNCAAGFKYLCVDPDDFGVQIRAMEYLYGLGHRRICFVGRSLYHPSYRIRREAYEIFMRQHGLPPYVVLSKKEIQSGFSEKFAELAVEEICSQPELPTAISFYNDISAVALYHALAERGFQIPRDISLVGCDDIPESALLRPPLTTFRFPAQRMATEAVSMLLNQIRDPKARFPSIRCEHEQIERGTCGPPREPLFGVPDLFNGIPNG